MYIPGFTQAKKERHNRRPPYFTKCGSVKRTSEPATVKETDMKKSILTLSLLWPAFVVMAQGASGLDPDAVPPPPDIPAPLESGQPIEPEVTIIQKEESMVEEYRVNGNLYMIKITPSVGASYYLIDRDGDGNMEFRTNTLGGDVMVPQWVLFRW
jgi:hypothetical protein